MRIKLQIALVALLVLVVGASIPHEASARGSEAEAYAPLRADPAVVASGVSTSVSLDSIASADREPVAGNPTIAVDCRLSSVDSAAGETCVVGVVLFRDTTIIGYFESTATAQPYTSDGYFLCKTLLFDSAGATHYYVTNESPSLGNAVLRSWAYGADSKASGE